MRTKTKASLLTLLTLTVALFGVPILGTQASIQADGETGTVQSSNQIFHVSGSVISINCYDLTVSADYNLNWTGENTGVDWTCSATQTKFTHTFVLTSSETTVVFSLRYQSAGTLVDSVQVTVVSLGSFLSTGLIISAGIFILIVVIFKRVAKR